MKKLEDNNKSLVKQQNEILKLIAQKLANTSQPKDQTLIEYQKQTILNLIEEKPRNEEELMRIIPISEFELLEILNNLLKMSIIKRSKDKNKYEVII